MKSLTWECLNLFYLVSLSEWEAINKAFDESSRFIDLDAFNHEFEMQEVDKMADNED